MTTQHRWSGNQQHERILIMTELNAVALCWSRQKQRLNVENQTAFRKINYPASAKLIVLHPFSHKGELWLLLLLKFKHSLKGMKINKHIWQISFACGDYTFIITSEPIGCLIYSFEYSWMLEHLFYLSYDSSISRGIHWPSLLTWSFQWAIKLKLFHCVDDPVQQNF